MANKAIPADQTLSTLLWRNVAVGAADQCWPWISYINRSGYGVFNPRRGVRHPAHRVALVLHGGEDHPELVVRHLCDNPKCCNPDHLAWGTHWANKADQLEARSRDWKGGLHPRVREKSPGRLHVEMVIDAALAAGRARRKLEAETRLAPRPGPRNDEGNFRHG